VNIRLRCSAPDDRRFRAIERGERDLQQAASRRETRFFLWNQPQGSAGLSLTDPLFGRH
jgi:hypothetical protein